MQNDTISRSKLIADLECFKLQLGDIILGFIHFWVKSHEDVKALEKSILDRIRPREVADSGE